MNKSLIQFRQKYGIPEAGSRVLCACSGGADSTALLHLLSTEEDLQVICAHFNHRLRGTEADRDERFVQSLCERLNIRFISGSGNVLAYADTNGIGIEEAARELRYRFLIQTAEATDCRWIATAHNAEDNAETVLLNLIRGSGLKGLCGIPPVRGQIIRPLLTVSRSDILFYLNEQGLPHIEDSSNQSDDYTRNRIRHHIIPFMLQQNSSAIQNITSTAELLREDEETLQREANFFLQSYLPEKGLPITALLALPKPVGSRALRVLCGPLSRAHVEAIFSICRNNSAHSCVDIPGNRVVREYDQLFFNPPEPEPIPETELVPDWKGNLGNWYIECQEEILKNEIYNSFNTFYFKSEKLCGKIIVASRKDGAKIRISGRNCTKTLKKLYSEAELTTAERIQTPVLYDSEGVIAVYGFGVAEHCQAEVGDLAIRVSITKCQKG